MNGRVLFVQYTNPGGYPPLVHSARQLADAGADVCMLGVDVHDGALIVPAHARITVVLWRPQPRGWRRRVHYLAFLVASVLRAALWRPTWIYASDPLSAPVAMLMRLVCRARVIYHEHDSPTTAVSQPSIVERVVARARAAVARKAAVCVVPNAKRAEALANSVGPAKVITVWNTPSREEASVPKTPAAAKNMRVLYHGSIVPELIPVTVVDALAQLPPEITLTVAGYETIGHPGYVNTLVARATELGVRDRLHLAGPLSRPLLIALARQCDVGLALMPSSSNNVNYGAAMIGASNKVFDYLAAGLPVVVTDRPEWVETYVRPGYGHAVTPESAANVANALRWFLDHSDQRVSMGERGRQQILREWNYETAFAPVMAMMGEAAPTLQPSTATVVKAVR